MFSSDIAAIPIPQTIKPFLSVMNDVKHRPKTELHKELQQFFNQTTGKICPVPGCACPTSFRSWGNLFDHFVDGTHKKEFFALYRDKYHRPYGEEKGSDFKFGVMALMIAQFLQPTSPEDAKVEAQRKTTKGFQPATITETPIITNLPIRIKKNKTQPDSQISFHGPFGNTTPTDAFPDNPAITHGKAPVSLSVAVAASGEGRVGSVEEEGKKAYPGAFSKVAEFIRNSDEINLVWRGKMLESYIEMFHGIPPCFHCRSAEGKQIHHQNPLFHEVVLLMLNKLGTTADKVWEAKENDDPNPLLKMLKEVADYHMKEGKVLAVPYCQACNQDAEAKRRRGKSTFSR